MLETFNAEILLLMISSYFSSKKFNKKMEKKDPYQHLFKKLKDFFKIYLIYILSFFSGIPP